MMMSNITSTEYIREAAQILKEHQLSKIEIQDNGIRILLEKSESMTVAVPVKQDVVDSSSDQPSTKEPVVVSSSTYEVKAPLVGVFYSSPSPEADSFVKIGDTVKKGDTLCIIEAMKLLNEIYAEHDGVILDICAANGDVVEFGQVVFQIGLEKL